MKKGRKKLVKQIASQLAMEFMGKMRVPRPAAPRRAAPKPVAQAVKTERKPIKNAARSRLNTKRPQQVNPFKVAEFPPSVKQSNAQFAMDEAINGLNQWAATAWGNYANSAFVEGVTFLGYTYLAELAQRPEYRVITEVIATEMTRKWIRLQAKGEKDKAKKIDELNAELDRLKVRDIFCKGCEVDGFFGRSHLYIDTGQSDDRDELRLPLGNGVDDLSKLKMKKGFLKRLAIIEPIWCYPASYNSNDPLKEDWYNPQTWFVQGKEVHVSRLLRFVGREVPDMLKPAYGFGGLALSQMAKPYVDNWLGVRQSVADIVQAFSVFVLKTDLSVALTPTEGGLDDRVDIFNNTRNNRGTFLIDEETEDFANVAAPLGTLDALQAQAQEHMAAVSRIPLVKLLGISPHGLNASAEPELRVFYDSIHAQQEKFFSPNLRIVFALAQINIWGKVDPDIGFVYEPLWSLDEKGAAEVEKLKAETGHALIDGGVIAPEEERARIAADPDTSYPGLDPNDLPDLKQEEEDGLRPGGEDNDDNDDNDADRREAA